MYIHCFKDVITPINRISEQEQVLSTNEKIEGTVSM